VGWTYAARVDSPQEIVLGFVAFSPVAATGTVA